MGVQYGLSRPSGSHPPVVLQRQAHTHLSLGCPLLRPPTGPHPRTHHPHLKQEGQEVRRQQGKRVLMTTASRKPPLGAGHSKSPTLQIRRLRLRQVRFSPEARAAPSSRVRSPVQIHLALKHSSLQYHPQIHLRKQHLSKQAEKFPLNYQGKTGI